MTAAVAAIPPKSSMTSAVCAATGVSRATVHRIRSRLNAPPAAARPRPRPVRALNDPQRRQVLDLLSTPRFADRVAKRTDAA